MPGSVDCNFIPADWQPFEVTPPEQNTIYIWHARLDDLLAQKSRFYDLLIPGERQAASRYHQDKHRDRYIIQHGLLRHLLGWYLRDKAYSSPFTFNPNKKPYLDNNACYFNISHTEGHLLLSIADVELGIDIEHINPQFHYLDIASEYFGSAEVKFIVLSKSPRNSFFLLWTRKEALLKSSGLGIDDYLPLIPALDGRHKLPSHFGTPDWLTHSFMIGEEHMGSITYSKGLQKAIKFYSCTGFSL